jgi:fructose transport system permease protein
MLAMFVVFAWVLKNTAWGRRVYAVGDDAEAARLAGVRTNRVLLSVYVVGGLICAVAGWMLIGRIASASPQAGGLANLDSITAVVIGGTSLFGGRGLVIGTLFGGVLRNGLTLGGVDVLWQDFAVGVLIIVAVAIDQWIRQVKA